MKAVVFDQDNSARIVNRPDPTIGPDEVLIRMAACGICGSDLHLEEINSFQLPYPFTPGHEVSGVVAETGSEIENTERGVHVVVQPAISCGTCRSCLRSRPNLCTNLQSLGLQRPGGFAEYVAVPAENVRLSGGLPDSVAACTEPLACALHGIARLAPAPDDTLILFGAGTIGLFTLQLFRMRSTGFVQVVDSRPARLAAARSLGADEAVEADARRGVVPEEISKNRFDAVVDATGVPTVVETALQFLTAGGTMLMVGSCPAGAPIQFVPRALQRIDAAVIGSFSYADEFDSALRLLVEGRIRTDQIVTHSFSLNDFEKALACARAGDDGIKVQINGG